MPSTKPRKKAIEIEDDVLCNLPPLQKTLSVTPTRVVVLDTPSRPQSTSFKRPKRLDDANAVQRIEVEALRVANEEKRKLKKECDFHVLEMTHLKKKAEAFRGRWIKGKLRSIRNGTERIGSKIREC
ncbi:hypothetical protein Adt_03166 [Abeliophyllum distichum]|uniref:Uncharacterized protein n=1 Tax=Abeliophyllum distichum TaxID=126358 RepID=A0ABD1VXR7_9LAMI